MNPKITLSKISKKEKIWMAIAVALAVLAALDRLAISPINNRMDELDRLAGIKEKQLSAALRNLKNKDAVINEHQRYLRYVKKSGSDEEEVARVLGEIENMARDSGVSLVDIKPHTPKKIGFHKEYTVEFYAEGSMKALTGFLYALNNSPLLLRAEKLHLYLREKESPVVTGAFFVTRVLIP